MALFEISREQIVQRIRYENPWWRDGRIDIFYRRMKKRLYFDKFFSLVSDQDIRRAVVLMGPRRVGKTVLIYHAIQELIDAGTDPLKICYLSVETPIFNGIPIEILFEYCRSIAGSPENPDGYHIFFDEIQYLKGWEVHLKSMVDSYHRTKFIVSGSAAAALKLQSNESGAGRFTDFTLPPLTFHEFIHLRNKDALIQTKTKEWDDTVVPFYHSEYIDELNDQFVDYINYGGYPEVSLSSDIQLDPGRYIKSDIVDKVLLRDLPSLYGIQDVQELNSLFTTIAFNSGNEFSFESLVQTSGVSKNTIKKYLLYLEAAFLIRQVERIDQSGKRFRRVSSFKLYLTNPSLRSALFSPLSASASGMGNMVETAIFSQWFHRYWQTPFYSSWRSGEVDIVGLAPDDLKPQWAVEVKWSNRYFDRPKELRSLLSFCRKNNLERAVVTTIDITDEKSLNEISIDYIPASVYCYVVGRRALDQTQL